MRVGPVRSGSAVVPDSFRNGGTSQLTHSAQGLKILFLGTEVNCSKKWMFLREKR
jgi:hypothetical protein